MISYESVIKKNKKSMSSYWRCSHIRKRRPFERRNPPKVAIGEGCPTNQPKVGRCISNFLVVYDGHKFDILTIRTSFKLVFHVSLFVLMVQDEAHTCSMIPFLITPGEYTSSARTKVPLVSSCTFAFSSSITSAAFFSVLFLSPNWKISNRP